MSHVTVIRVYTTRIAKQQDELLISILLLLLVRPIYLSMSLGVHLNTYTSIYEQVEVYYWKLMKN